MEEAYDDYRYKKQEDNEDDEREDEFDLFEKQCNFRFEDPNAANITSHARPATEKKDEAEAGDSLRRKDNVRQ
jgi:hypothetical protein